MAESLSQNIKAITLRTYHSTQLTVATMKRIADFTKKVRVDYAEFQRLHQPIAEPWRKEDKVIKLESYSWSGLKKYVEQRTENYEDAVKVWKLQLRNPDAAIKILNGESDNDKEKGSTGSDLVEKGLAELKNPENVEKLQKTATSIASTAVENFKNNTKEAKRLVEDNKEDAKEFVYDRLKIMSDALRNFNLGYQEGKAQGQADAMSKSPEELYADIVHPLQQKISRHVEDVVKNHDVDSNTTNDSISKNDSDTTNTSSSSSGSSTAPQAPKPKPEPVTPAEYLLRHAKEALTNIQKEKAKECVESNGTEPLAREKIATEMLTNPVP